jgi:putative Mg2+ transporter-C (MgtC) family protein
MKGAEVTLAIFLTRLAVAAILGIAIGFERQWRQRSAGLQTSSLVAVGAALFTMLDVVIGAGDSTRIVAGIVTGVGFIGGGVILRTGLGISGLNTAATIWASAAVGALAGFGLGREAALGAAGIIVLNLVLAPFAEAIDARAHQHQGGERVYKLEVTCDDAESQPSVAAALLAAISESPLSLQSLTRHHADDDRIELRAEIYAAKPADASIEKLSTQLLAMTGVVRTHWRSAIGA